MKRRTIVTHRMNRRLFVAGTSALVSLALPFVAAFDATPASAQPPSSPLPKIGFLANTPPLSDLVNRTGSQPAAKLFEEGLRERGWEDGRNVRIVWKSAEGSTQRLPALAQELVDARVDVIVAFGPGVVASVAKTRTIPIVMGAIGNFDGPPQLGTMAQPAMNVTGTTLEVGATMDGKRLALLKRTSPAVTRVAFVGPYGPTVPETTKDAARSLGIGVVAVRAEAMGDLPAAFDKALREGANGIVVRDWPQVHWPEMQKTIHELAIRHRLPVIHSVLSAGETGALLVYASDINDNYRRAPYYVDRILRGAKPSDLPIEQPTRFRLIVNRKAAEAIGLPIPASLLAEADQVVQ